MLDRVRVSVRSTSKSSGSRRTGVPPPAPGDGVAQRPLDVEVEGVAPLVGLGVVGALVARALPLDLRGGPPGPSPAWRTGRRGRCWPMARRPRGVSSSRPSRFSMSPASVSMPGQLGQPLQAAGGVVAQQLAGHVDVDLGQGARATGPTTAGSRAGRGRPAASMRSAASRHAQRVATAAARLEPAVPALAREGALEVLREAVDLPAQVHVVEELGRQGRSWARCSGESEFMKRLHRRHPPGHGLQQLVEGLRVLGEEVAVLRHEPVEVGLLAPGPLVEHGVERRRACPWSGPSARAWCCPWRRPSTGELALEELLAQLVQQLLEALGGGRRDEVVLLQRPHLAGQVGGSRSSAMRRSAMASPTTSCRRGSPDSRAASSRSSMAARSVSTTSRSSLAMSSYTPPRSWLASSSRRRWRRRSSSSRRPAMRSPSRSFRPSWSMRRRAAFTSPW